MRRFVLGDIHGNIEALEQVLDRAPIDPQEDQLIFLGDVADGHKYTYECVETLLGFENLVAIKGNHDHWAEQWMNHGVAPYIWRSQGGNETIWSYTVNCSDELPQSHVDYFNSTIYYYLSEDNKLFTHGGVTPYVALQSHDPKDFMWDRDLWRNAVDRYYSRLNEEPNADEPLTEYDNVYIGHTSTWGTYKLPDTPVRGAEVWLLDQGAGWDGRLTLMDVDTKEFWQSDDGWKGGR